ncbi:MULTISPECIES: SusC/RagA family TonB-linked outer membrane protein [Sphingobacterium]|uniref:SusC/RagA family TonB-linked outer membrane protein n=2 Tax=Sphingobacteriaceae TaxID=84566 RepID=UPI0013D9DBEB|nr:MULTISPECIES: SusC/RagA family TonB-linked outer membrane protein [unclassified Sphingobacterium]
MKFYLTGKNYFFLKMLCIMKFILILLLGTFMHVSAHTYAQKITLHAQNKTLEEVLQKISLQSEYDFVYSANMLKTSIPVNVDLRAVDLEKALDICFKNQPVTYTLWDNTVIVKLREINDIEKQSQHAVSGVVRDEKGTPMSGVGVRVKGTNVGTVTAAGGLFSLQVPTQDAVLIFSFLGYNSKEVTVNKQSQLQVTLTEKPEILDDVVVTALGIKRQKKELGYAVSDIDGKDITGFGETNAIASLAGKVAGVSVSTTTNGPSSSSRVVIRGIRELQGSNQPLYVIDGVPAVNGNIGSADKDGGFDLGDGLGDINPNDIENISVLKGASAAVLYGSRALNGVILITTKNGAYKKGLGIDFNSTLTTETISTKFDEEQKIYGQGSNGLLPRDATNSNNIASSWGPRFTDAETIFQKDGSVRPYKYIKNNIQDFFQTGVTAMNTISLTGGNKDHNLYASYSNVTNKDIVPTGKFDRNNISFKGSSKIFDQLTLDVKGSLMFEKVKNRPALTDDINNIGNALLNIAANFDQSWLQNYQNEDGSYIDYTGNPYRANPYWTLNKTLNDSKKVRTGGSANLTYKFNENWSANASAGTDFYKFDFFNFYDLYTPNRAGGSLRMNQLNVREDNFQALLNFSKDISSKFKVDAMAGGNIMKFNRDQILTNGAEINAPGKPLITNFREVQVIPSNPRKEIQSLFGNVMFGYNQFLFLNLQGRNDWSSTLPKGNNSYFYPAADLSVVLSDAFNFSSSAVNYAKLRTSYGQVGSDTDPYKTSFMYSLTGQSMNGLPMGEILGDVIPNAKLKPQRKNSFEVGADLSFFQNRIGLDFTYYNEITKDVLLDLPVNETTGFRFASLNAAKLKNTGVEILLKSTVLSLENSFKWNLSLNFAKNYNTVLDITSGLDAYTVAEARWAGTTIIAEKGKPFGSIIGRTFVLDEQGRRVHDNQGIPIYTTDPQTLASTLPDWTGGMTNSFQFKGFELRTVIDIRKGGSMYSITNRTMHENGTHLNTQEGRDSWNEYNQERRAFENAGGDPDEINRNNRGFVGAGVNEKGEANTIGVDPYIYWRSVVDNTATPFIYDGGYVKLRDVGLSYTLPKGMIKNFPLHNLSLGIVGRNLWIMSKHVPNIDPESNYNNGNGQGLEYGSLPGRRSIGFNLKASF